MGVCMIDVVGQAATVCGAYPHATCLLQSGSATAGVSYRLESRQMSPFLPHSVPHSASYSLATARLERLPGSPTAGIESSMRSSFPSPLFSSSLSKPLIHPVCPCPLTSPGCLGQGLQSLYGKQRAFIVTDKSLFDLGYTETVSRILDTLGIHHEVGGGERLVGG